MYMPIVSVNIAPITSLDDGRFRVKFPGRVEILSFFTGSRCPEGLIQHPMQFAQETFTLETEKVKSLRSKASSVKNAWIYASFLPHVLLSCLLWHKMYVMSHIWLNAFVVSVERHEGNIQHGRHRLRLENNIKMKEKSVGGHVV
jgi:hypothetical protein